jgi:hypothetical protein
MRASVVQDYVYFSNHQSKFQWLLPPVQSSTRALVGTYEAEIPSPSTAASIVVHRPDGAQYTCCDLAPCGPPSGQICKGLCREWMVLDRSAATNVAGVASLFADATTSFAVADVTLNGTSAAVDKATLKAVLYNGEASSSARTPWQGAGGAGGLTIPIEPATYPYASRLGTIRVAGASVPAAQAGGALHSLVLEAAGAPIAACTLRQCDVVAAPAAGGGGGGASKSKSNVGAIAGGIAAAAAVLLALVVLGVVVCLRRRRKKEANAATHAQPKPPGSTIAAAYMSPGPAGSVVRLHLPLACVPCAVIVLVIRMMLRVRG